MSALPPKADNSRSSRDVRFVPIATKVRRSKLPGYSISSRAAANLRVAAGAARRVRGSRNGRYGKFSGDRADQSGLTPANLITLPHLSISLAMSLPKSAAEPASTMPPRSVSFALIPGSASPELISVLSF